MLTLDFEEKRRHAALYLRWACGGPDGRTESDPIYQQITEGRDAGRAQKSYSSCGDLAHSLYEFLGVRSDWVNRSALGYQIGRNVSNLAYHQARRTPRYSDTFGTGDVLIVWSKQDTTDAHVICVLGHDGIQVLTAEFGQPGGALRERTMTQTPDGGFLFGQRKAHVWLPLPRVLAMAEAARELVATDPTLLGAIEAYPEQGLKK